MSADHSDQIKRIVSEFRAGRLNRRQFLGMVATLSGGAAISAAGRPSISVRDLFAPETYNRLAAAPAPQTLIYGATQDIGTLDPSDKTDYSILAGTRQVYDRLFRFESDWPQTVQPGLCQKYEASTDSKEWTFHLTDKAKFHDGTPVTAESVVYSYQRTLRFKKQRASLLSGYLDESSVVAKDSNTVVMTLKTPYASFDRLLAFLEQPIVSMDAAKKNDKSGDEGAAYFVDHEAGSGPFTIKSWNVGDSYQFDAVPDYWQGFPGDSHLSGFTWKIVRDNGTRKQALIAGELDVADSISPSDLKDLQANADLTMFANYGLLAGYFKMNTQQGPTADVNFRKFLAYSFNRKAYADSQEGLVQAMTGPLPKGVPGYDPNLQPSYSYDPVKAKQYLDMTKYKDGGFSIDFVYVTGLDFEEAAGLVLLDELKKYKITLNMVPKTFPDIEGLCTKPDTGPALGYIFDQFPPLPDTWLIEKYDSKSWDRPTGGSFQACSFYKNADVDKMIDQLRVAVDQKQVTDLVQKIQTQVSQDAPDIPVLTFLNIVGFRKHVKGYKYYGDISVDFWRLWIDDTK